MSTHKQKKDATDKALDALSTEQLIQIAEMTRKMWRQEVAAGTMKLDPKRMRAFDAEIKELKQLARG